MRDADGRAASGFGVRHDGSARRVLLVDLVWAIGESACATGVLLWVGGIGTYLNAHDLSAALVPRYEAAVEAARDLRLPLWNPWEFGGMPLLGTMQGAMLHPPTLLVFGLLPPMTAVQVFYALHFVVLFWGATAYVRHRGMPRAVGALPGAVAWGANLIRPGVDHPSHIASLALVPALLVCVENAAAAAGRGWRRWVAAAAALYALEWLAGYPDYPLNTAVVVAILGVAGPTETLARRLLLVAAALALGVTLAAAQIVPALEVVREGARTAYEGLLPGMRWSFLGVRSPADLGMLIVELLGVGGIVLAAVGLFWGRLAAAWLLVLVWGLVPANMPFVLLYRLPAFSSSRIPVAWFDLAALAGGFLAAAGATVIWRRPSWWWRGAALVLGCAALLHAALSVSTIPRRFTRKPPDAAVVAARVATEKAIQASLPGQPGVVSPLERLGGAFLGSKLRSPTGYEPSGLEPIRTRVLNERLGIAYGGGPWTLLVAHPDLAALVGIGLVAVERTRQAELLAIGFRPLADLPPADVLLYRPAVPRVRLVHRAVVVADAAASLAIVTEHPTDAATTVVLEGTPPAVEPVVPATTEGESVAIVVDLPEHVEVEVAAATAGVLVLRDTCYPGWRATVDGAAADLRCADHAFRAVSVGPGPHRVTFVYAPASVRIGFALSAVGALALIAMLLG